MFGHLTETVLQLLMERTLFHNCFPGVCLNIHRIVIQQNQCLAHKMKASTYGSASMDFNFAT